MVETKQIKPIYYIKYEFKKMLASLWSLCFVSLKIYWPRGCWIPTILDWQTRYFSARNKGPMRLKLPSFTIFLTLYGKNKRSHLLKIFQKWHYKHSQSYCALAWLNICRVLTFSLVYKFSDLQLRFFCVSLINSCDTSITYLDNL